MFGKWFSQTYTGSMFGAGPSVFAVWSYVVAHVQFETVELNPLLIAAVLGDTPDNIGKALDYLCSPDSKSRSEREEGRRLIREGEYIYRVVNATKYRGMRNEHDRREYNRQKKAESRSRQTVSTSESTSVSHRQPPSAVVSPSQRTDHRPQNTESKGLGFDLDLKKQKRARFTRPTLPEISAYLRERKSSVDGQVFLDFYESKGWRVGNQPMSDWKAAIRNWERRELKPKQGSGQGILSVDGADLQRKAAERLGGKK